MIKRIDNLITIIMMSVVVLTAGGCGRKGVVLKELDMAERLMDTLPDSALVLLESIPISDIRGKAVAARYAMLKSMALDKNYIDTTTFDVLQPAIDYYLTSGTPDERLRTYYYQGRIYQNRGDEDSAMYSFMNACDLQHRVTDSSTLAHTFVAQGNLYRNQYKAREFIHNNMEAAKLYGALGKELLEIRCYVRVVRGYLMMDDSSAADSLLSVCMALVQKNPDGEKYLFPSLLSYTVEYGSSEEIKVFLDEYQDVELTQGEMMDFACGYSKIGEHEKAMGLLSKVRPGAFLSDSLKYEAVKVDIYERQGKYEQALNAYKDFYVMLDRYHDELLSQNLLFSEKKHQLEKENLVKIQGRDRVIGATLFGILLLVILVGWLYYRGNLNMTKRILAEKENENLRLEQDNLRLEFARLESERDNLTELQKEQTELAKPIQDIIKTRLDMLNGLLAKEITNDDSYADPYNKWIEAVHKDKKGFMDSARVAFTASHPRFMEYLEHHGLSTDEINYLCLYAIGLRGKDVGEYLQLKRHYIVSHEIRKKLGIGEHETNIGIYVRKLMKDSAGWAQQ